ncbi:hypothetical protein CPB86DRAFT_788650 [Serendipita vermifera]|nr:hypothetical protein CPB86DRAFT_788650 [Serendipita vermifera]
MEQILQDCGISSLVQLLRVQIHEKDWIGVQARDCSPPRAYPSPLLLSKLQCGASSVKVLETSADYLTHKLPDEILEEVLFWLEDRELFHLTQTTRRIAAFSLARLYHDLEFKVAASPTAVIRCLKTLAFRPHLAGLVCSLKICTDFSDKGILHGAHRLLTQAIIAIAPTVYAIHLQNLYGSAGPNLLTLPPEFPRLRILRLHPTLNWSGRLQTGRAQGRQLAYLEGNVEHIRHILWGFPNLHTLHVSAIDFSHLPINTFLAQRLHHPTIQTLCVMLMWSVDIDSQFVSAFPQAEEEKTFFPSVRRLTFTFKRGPMDGYYGNVLDGFLAKTPNLVTLVLDAMPPQPAKLQQWKIICPKLVNILNKTKEWVYDDATRRCSCIDRYKLQDSLSRMNSFATLKTELQETVVATVPF